MDWSLLTVGSVLFDAVFVPGGDKSVETLRGEAAAVLFVNEAYKHCKAIAATGAGAALLPARVDGPPAGRDSTRRVAEDGIVLGDDEQVASVAAELIKAVAQHRHWES